MIHPCAVRHPASARHQFYELVCIEGWALSPAVAAVGGGEGTATRWWRKAVGMNIAAPRRDRRVQIESFSKPEAIRRPLTYLERSLIQHGIANGHTQVEIAYWLGRNRSIISRELKRNVCEDGFYDAAVAQFKADAARSRPKDFKLDDPLLAAMVTARLEKGWSPQLIALTLRSEFPDRDDLWVSHETIYQAIYVQGRGLLRADLRKHLSTQRPRRYPQSRAARAGGVNTSPFKEAFTISQRPAEVADRAVPGHWEGDLIVGPYSRSAIGTLVERTTRFTILLHLPGRHTAAEVADAMIREMNQLPEHLRRTLTWDRGVEMADYARIQTELKMPVYFCDPRSPWQRGSNENTNRLLRHWFPKGVDLKTFTPEDLRAAQDLLNTRPRPTLNLETPATRLNRLLAQAA